jgi:single-stranded DNA-binding protein
MGLIKTEILGAKVWTEPEKRFTATGKEVASFRASVSKKKDEGYDNVNLDITVWEPADSVYQINKGDKVKLTGRLWPRLYQKKDGSTGLSLDISAESVEIDDYGSQPKDEPMPF